MSLNTSFTDPAGLAEEVHVDAKNGRPALQQGSDCLELCRTQAVQLHAWLGEYIEATKPKLPTAGESVVRARVPNGDTISLIKIGLGQVWRSSTGADYDSSELRDWTLIFDAGRPL